MFLDLFSSGDGFVSQINEFFNKVSSLSFGPSDFLDILLVAFVIYYAVKFFKGTKALQLLKGLLLLLICYVITYLLKMETSLYIFRYVFQNIFIIIIIVFQPEIRQIVERIGRRKIGSFKGIFSDISNEDSENENKAVVEICKAVQRMSDSKTGALIVLEKESLPITVTNTGTLIDAAVSHELIGNLFYPKSPLHDGAAIIRDGRVYKAGCVLPNTKSESISSDLGTRHRAAIGISEESNALAVVVSEETGQISTAINGKLRRDFDESTLRDFIFENMSESKETPVNSKGWFSKLFSKGKKQ